MLCHFWRTITPVGAVGHQPCHHELPKGAKPRRSCIIWLAAYPVFAKQKTLRTRLVGSKPAVHLDDAGRSYSGSDTPWARPSLRSQAEVPITLPLDVFPVSEDVTV